MTTMRQRWLRVAVIASAVALITACTRDAVRYETADELAGALTHADVECSTPQAGRVAKLVRSHSSCAYGDSRLELYVFDSEQERDNWLEVGARMAPVAVGPNWVVTADAEAAQRAASALHARFEAPEA
jgi:hypothetical protein